MPDILSMLTDRQPTESDFSELQGILPEQFYGARWDTSVIEPLGRLMIAMLVDAIRELRDQVRCASARHAPGICRSAFVDLL